MYGLGCRVTELIQLNLSDIYEIEKYIKVLGKGGKERLVPLNDFLVDSLKDYITNVRALIYKPNSHSPTDTNYLIVNDRGHRPSRVDIWRWLVDWSKSAGFEKAISPHQFRHGCATALLDGGADLRSIQLLLGHTSIKTTQIYTSVSASHLKSTVDQCHPLSPTFNDKI